MQHRISTSNELAQLIRSYRLESQMPQRELAAGAGISRPAVSDIESGGSGLRLTTLLRLLDALGLDLIIGDREQSDSAIDLDEILGLHDSP